MGQKVKLCYVLVASWDTYVQYRQKSLQLSPQLLRALHETCGLLNCAYSSVVSFQMSVNILSSCQDLNYWAGSRLEADWKQTGNRKLNLQFAIKCKKLFLTFSCHFTINFVPGGWNQTGSRLEAV